MVANSGQKVKWGYWQARTKPGAFIKGITTTKTPKEFKWLIGSKNIFPDLYDIIRSLLFFWFPSIYKWPAGS